MKMRLFHEISGSTASRMFKSDSKIITDDAYVDFCLNNCPYKKCSKGTCKEFENFKKENQK